MPSWIAAESKISWLTYSWANTPLGQSERAYYLSYFMTAVTYNSQLLSKALKQIFSSLILFLSSNFYFSLFSFFSYFSRVKLWFSIKLIATEFFQRHLILGWLCNNILKIRQNRFGETWEKLAIKIFNFHHRRPNFRKITNSDKTFDNCFFFLKNFRYNIANVFWVVLV